MELNVGPVLGGADELWRHRLARPAPARIEFYHYDAILLGRVRDQRVVAVRVLNPLDVTRGEDAAAMPQPRPTPCMHRPGEGEAGGAQEHEQQQGGVPQSHAHLWPRQPGEQVESTFVDVISYW